MCNLTNICPLLLLFIPNVDFFLVCQEKNLLLMTLVAVLWFACQDYGQNSSLSTVARCRCIWEPSSLKSCCAKFSLKKKKPFSLPALFIFWPNQMAKMKEKTKSRNLTIRFTLFCLSKCWSNLLMLENIRCRNCVHKWKVCLGESQL